MKNVDSLVSAHVEHQSADRLRIAIRAAFGRAPWHMVLLRATWKSLGSALAAAYVADCYLSAHARMSPRPDRAGLVSAIQFILTSQPAARAAAGARRTP